MTRARIAAVALAAVLVLVGLVLVLGRRDPDRRAAPSPASSPLTLPTPAVGEVDDHRGFLYGRVATLGGASYEGRLRWGGDEEAFWSDAFNGARDENPWVALVPPERRPKERRRIEAFGITFATLEREVEVDRLFMARFGDIARVEPRGGDVRVTLKSGTVVDLDRFSASDFDDGVRVWDGSRGVVDLDSTLIRSVELLPTPRLASAPRRLHGTVRTRRGDFTGFVQWDRQLCTGDDELRGVSGGGEMGLPFDAIRAIARRSRDGSLVTLLDGREVLLSGGAAGRDNRGVYVDDRRYGRVLVSWDAFERLDLTPGGSGPAYGDFPPGRPITGTVTARDGRALAGRLVYDLDESETTETLDAPSGGVNYMLPFGLVSSIEPPGPDGPGARLARVTLHDGEVLELEGEGDLGEGNAGLLVFVDGRPGPEYLPWSDVRQIRLDRPDEPRPPSGGP